MSLGPPKRFPNEWERMSRSWLIARRKAQNLPGDHKKILWVLLSHCAMWPTTIMLRGCKELFENTKLNIKNAKVIISNSLAMLCWLQNEARWRDLQKTQKGMKCEPYQVSVPVSSPRPIPPHINTSTTLRRYCPYQAMESSLKEAKLDSEHTAERNFRTNQTEANLLSLFNR